MVIQKWLPNMLHHIQSELFKISSCTGLLQCIEPMYHNKPSFTSLYRYLGTLCQWYVCWCADRAMSQLITRYWWIISVHTYICTLPTLSPKTWIKKLLESPHSHAAHNYPFICQIEQGFPTTTLLCTLFPSIAKDPSGLDSDPWIPLRSGARIPRGL